jgi:hypothetical protein
MEQRNVVITAIVLALILAGILWYTLSQDSITEEALATPTPTVLGEQNVGDPNVEQPAQNYDNLPDTLPESTPASAVQPTATSGPTENIIALMVLAMLLGASGVAYHAISIRT